MKLLELDAKIKPPYLEAIEEHGDFFVVRLQGDLTTHALEQNQEKMQAVMEAVDLYRKPVLCDFGKVTDSDTATLAVLIQRISEFRKHGGQKMVFFNVQEELLGLFEIAHLLPFFEIRKTQEEAAAALESFKCKIGKDNS